MTDTERWSNLSQSWDKRIMRMSKYIKSNSSVLDVGCGKMALKKYLKDCRYQGLDIIERDNSVIVCDLNGVLPDLKTYDYAFCSGVLEYVYYVERFIAWLTTVSTKVILSYKTIDNINEKNGWVNDLSEGEIIDLFCANGFVIKEYKAYEKYGIYYFEKKGKDDKPLLLE